ncbi:MAG: domain containing protein, partial [Mucilaginibacter sp.]|nr:domain containing protein [Mucilaginibacter sp.]
MDKTFTKRLFFVAIFTLFTLTGAFAQTITVGAVVPGPYGQGSSITVPITINDASACIDQSNTFTLYLSDASGNFAPGTPIGNYTGFYTPFINGVIPTGTPAGAGYKVEVKASNPATISTVSSAFTINTSTGVTASVSSNKTVAAGVFGQCVGAANSPFIISNTSAAGTTVTASFFNTQTQSFEATNIPIPTTGYTFTAASTTTYTVIVKTVDASGTVGTFQYQLINNPVHQNIGSAGNNFVCLVSNVGDLSFSIDISALSAGGIGANYLGDTYVLNWGDGTSTTFTYCQLKALGGVVTHTFTLPSCGQTAGNGDSNAFYVTNSPISPYCGQITAAPGVSAKVIKTPTTSFTAPAVACVGTALTIPNTSDPGPDYSLGASSTCLANPGALYDWTLDGVAVVGYQGVLRSKSFIFPVTTTHGNHTLTLHSELPPSGVGCQAPDYTQTICFENPPQPIFSIPSQICITSGPVTPTNTSVIDATCGVDTYAWTVTGPGTVTYAGGTSSTSALPQFVFPVAGVYTVQLGINSGGCGLILAAAQTIRVDAVPTASLSPDVTICGNNLSLTFDPSQTITKTTFSGTAQTQPTTYTWSVSSLSGGTYSFSGGTTVNSEFPIIHFD